MKRKNGTDWSYYGVGEVQYQNLSPTTKGAGLYTRIVPDPSQFIRDCARRVLATLYFSPADSIPGVETIVYKLGAFDGISAKDGQPPLLLSRLPDPFLINDMS